MIVLWRESTYRLLLKSCCYRAYRLVSSPTSINAIMWAPSTSVWTSWFFVFFFFCLFRATPEAYGGCQVRGWIEAIATSLRHSLSNSSSEPHLQPTPQLTVMLSEAKGQTCILMDARQMHFHWAEMGTTCLDFWIY